uniref:uncharacterized protein isoform X2 n=1 Tax=Myxine glutinosa TaxID=7769 RepID=UPI00358DDC01
MKVAKMQMAYSVIEPATKEQQFTCPFPLEAYQAGAQPSTEMFHSQPTTTFLVCGRASLCLLLRASVVCQTRGLCCHRVPHEETAPHLCPPASAHLPEGHVVRNGGPHWGVANDGANIA